MTVECLTHDSRSAHVLHTIILVLNDFYWAVIPKYMLLFFYHIWLSCSGSFGLYEWICHLLYVRGCSHCHSWIAVKGLVMQPFGHTRVLEWKKKTKKQQLKIRKERVRIYLTRQRSEASVQSEGSELSSVELGHLMSVLTEIHLTLNL